MKATCFCFLESCEMLVYLQSQYIHTSCMPFHLLLLVNSTKLLQNYCGQDHPLSRMVTILSISANRSIKYFCSWMCCDWRKAISDHNYLLVQLSASEIAYECPHMWYVIRSPHCLLSTYWFPIAVANSFLAAFFLGWLWTWWLNMHSIQLYIFSYSYLLSLYPAYHYTNVSFWIAAVLPSSSVISPYKGHQSSGCHSVASSVYCLLLWTLANQEMNPVSLAHLDFYEEVVEYFVAELQKGILA